MDKKLLILLAVAAALALLYPLSRLLPQSEFLQFSTRNLAVGIAVPQGAPALRAKAGISVPRRYIEAAREDATRLMAEPGWQRLSFEEKQSRLMEIFILCSADVEYWTMPEGRQRRIAGAFLAAFLGEPPGALVDK
jgi:hypothetical protein